MLCWIMFSLGVTDINRSRRFYGAVPRPLGLVRIVDFGEGRGSDYDASPGSPGVEFTITREAEVRTPIPGAHICFRALDRAAVDAFHAVALPCGDTTTARPGFGRAITQTTTAPSCWKPDGRRVETVCHVPTSPTLVASAIPFKHPLDATGGGVRSISTLTRKRGGWMLGRSACLVGGRRHQPGLACIDQARQTVGPRQQDCPVACRCNEDLHEMAVAG